MCKWIKAKQPDATELKERESIIWQRVVPEGGTSKLNEWT